MRLLRFDLKCLAWEADSDACSYVVALLRQQKFLFPSILVTRIKRIEQRSVKMGLSSKKLGKKDLKLGPLPGNIGVENLCPIVSITDLTPEKLCDCATQLLQQVTNIKAMLQHPEDIVTSIWASDSFLYGPESIGSSSGWWFSVHKPELKINNDNLSIKLKCGVKKTRGVLQFPWREASHTFEVNLPAEINQYNQAIAEVEKIEQVLISLKQTICQFPT